MLLRHTLAAAGLGLSAALGAAVVLGGASWGGLATDAERQSATLALAPISLGNPTAAARLRATGPGRADEPMPVAVDKVFHETVKVRRGDTLPGLLMRSGVGGSDARAAAAAIAGAFDPRRIRNGQEIRILYRPYGAEDAARRATPGRFHGFSLEPDIGHEVRIARLDGGGFQARKIAKTLTRSEVGAEGRIDLSLYLAGKRAGLPAATLAELIRAFSWDVDFQRDIRRGDSFEVIYEQVVDSDGDVVDASTIRFAALTLSGKRHPIYRYATADGETDYYDDKGLSARKALMRTPIDGARLSSGYGKRRHPILGYNKMHRGVDFAAPRGTPLYAAGNGTVSFAGRKGAYGNYIQIRHNSEYSTAYAHLKGFARSVRSGKRVKQGQVIGYVGSTGRSTGPHLHYEILRSGRRTNPLKVRMPSGRRLKGDELAAFQLARAAIDARLLALAADREKVALKND